MINSLLGDIFLVLFSPLKSLLYFSTISTYTEIPQSLLWYTRSTARSPQAPTGKAEPRRAKQSCEGEAYRIPGATGTQALRPARCSESPGWARRTAGSRSACITQRTWGRPKLYCMAWLYEEINNNSVNLHNNVNPHNGRDCKLRGKSVILFCLCSAVRILNTKCLRESRRGPLCVPSTQIVMVYHRHAVKCWVRPECM